MREGAACSRRGARAVLLCITCTCFKSGEDSLLPWLRCGSVATRLFFCQLFLQGLQQMCKESVPIAAEHLHLPCERTPSRLATCTVSKGSNQTKNTGFFWTLSERARPPPSPLSIWTPKIFLLRKILDGARPPPPSFTKKCPK